MFASGLRERVRIRGTSGAGSPWDQVSLLGIKKHRLHRFRLRARVSSLLGPPRAGPGMLQGFTQGRESHRRWPAPCDWQASANSIETRNSISHIESVLLGRAAEAATQNSTLHRKILNATPWPAFTTSWANLTARDCYLQMSPRSKVAASHE